MLPGPLGAEQGAEPGGGAAVAGLSETYQDWELGCTDLAGSLICTLSQDVRSAASGERVLSARIDLAAGDTPRLTLVLPLGLDLHAGVALHAGMAPDPLATVAPRLCQASECYAFLALDSAFLQGLEDRTFLRLQMTPFNAEPREVPLSLHGLPAALDRLRALQG